MVTIDVGAVVLVVTVLAYLDCCRLSRLPLLDVSSADDLKEVNTRRNGEAVSCFETVGAGWSLGKGTKFINEVDGEVLLSIFCGWQCPIPCFS